MLVVTHGMAIPAAGSVCNSVCVKVESHGAKVEGCFPAAAEFGVVVVNLTIEGNTNAFAVGQEELRGWIVFINTT